jgi:hypothetical protein
VQDFHCTITRLVLHRSSLPTDGSQHMSGSLACWLPSASNATRHDMIPLSASDFSASERVQGRRQSSLIVVANALVEDTSMTNLADFGGGIVPEQRDTPSAHDTRSDRARHRRRTYRLGRCRALSKAKGCRCGGASIEDSDGELCHYHSRTADPPTIDSAAGLVARWCGTRPTTWEEIPELCRVALMDVSSR